MKFRARRTRVWARRPGLVYSSQKGLPDTQLLLDARQNANATCKEVHEAQMAQIYELDKAMSVFEAVNPELFKGYQTAQALLDSGGGKAKKGQAEQPA